MPAAPRWFALQTWGALAILAGIVAFTATAGLTGSIAAAALVGPGLAAAVLGRLFGNPAANAALAGVPPGIRRLFAIGAPLLVGQLLFAAAFMIDPNLAHWEVRPWTPQRSAHSCVSSYWVACDHIRTAPDIYAEEIYSVPQADPRAPRVPRPIGPLAIDQYEYPPSFLALPRLIAAVSGDFWGFRRIWFALNLAVIVAGLVIVAARFDRALGTYARWLTPFGLLAPAMVITLVMGNVQLAIIAASMLAMVLFERGRHAAGGALLAYAIVSKLYPGLLLLYLLLRRDWRAVAWTAVFSIAIVAVTIADFGVSPYVAFLTHLPKLLGGEAFPAFRNPDRDRRQRIDSRTGVQAAAVRRAAHGLCRVEGGRLDLHGRRGRARRPAGASARRRGPRTARLDRHPDPRDDAEPVPADLRAVPVALAGDAAGRAHVGPVGDLHDVARGLGRPCLHVRRGRRAASRERHLDVHAHDRRLRAPGHRHAARAGALGQPCGRALGRRRLWSSGWPHPESC